MKKYQLSLVVHQEPTEPFQAPEMQVIDITLNGVTGRKLHDIVSMATDGLIESGQVTPPIITDEQVKEDIERLTRTLPESYNPPPKMKRRRLFTGRSKKVPKPDGFKPNEVDAA